MVKPFCCPFLRGIELACYRKSRPWAQYTIDTKYRVDNGDQCLLRRRYPASVIQGSRGGVSKGPQGDGTSPIAMALMKDRLRWVDLEFDSDGQDIFQFPNT